MTVVHCTVSLITLPSWRAGGDSGWGCGVGGREGENASTRPNAVVAWFSVYVLFLLISINFFTLLNSCVDGILI